MSLHALRTVVHTGWSHALSLGVRLLAPLRWSRNQGGRSGTAAASFLGLLLGATLLAAPPAEAQATVQTFGPGRGTNCPNGNPPLTLTVQDCYPNPNDCTQSLVLDWNSGGAPAGILSIPKFDPSLGDLTEVELRLSASTSGGVCVDNQKGASTCGVDISYTFNGFAAFSVVNNPPITIVSPSLVWVSSGSLISGTLGVSDGTDECFPFDPTILPPTPVLPVVPNGVDDSALAVWDYTLPLSALTINSQSDLDAWILTSGLPTDVVLDVTALGAMTTTSCSTLDPETYAQARVSVLVDYIYCPNAIPVCNATQQTVPEDGTVDIDLTDHVSDLDGCLDCSTFQIVVPPTNGQLLNAPSCTGWASGTGDADGDPATCDTCTSCLVTYQPNLDYCGPDSITIRVLDDDGAEAICEIPILVQPVNDPPVCALPSPTLETNEATPIVLDLCSYVTDVDEGTACGDGIDCTSVLQPTSSCGGTWVDMGGGSWQFTPPVNFCTDGGPPCQITFTVCDTGGECVTCVLPLIVNGVNVPPLCNAPAQPLSTLEDTPIDLDLCLYVIDPDEGTGCGSGIDCSSIGLPTSSCGGSFANLGGGTWRFTPPLDYCTDGALPCEITFTACDFDGACVTCVVQVDVVGVNDPPECAVPPLPLTTAEETPILIDFCQYVTDVDEGTNCGSGIDCSSIGTPTASCGGTFTPQGPGTYLYTPPLDYCSKGGPSCEITFTVCDLAGECVTCVLPIVVTGINDPPECALPGVPLSTLEDTPIVLALCTYVTDVDAGTACGSDVDCASIGLPTSSCGGSFVDLGGGNWEFTPPTDFCTDGAAPCLITFTACDTDGECVTCELPLEVVGVNDPPECALPVPGLSTPEETPIVLELCNYVDDVDESTSCGAWLDCASIGMPTSSCGGTFVDLGGGDWEFTPPLDVCTVGAAPCLITFTVCDLAGECVTCELPLEITGVNDPPECNVPTAVIETDEDTAVDLPLCGWVTDVDAGTSCGNPIDCGSIVTPISSCGGTFADLGSGVWRFTPPQDLCTDTTLCTIAFTVCDTGGECVTCEVQVLIRGVNDIPTCEPPNPPLSTLEDTPIVLDLCGYVDDVDAGTTCGAPLDCSTIAAPTSSCGGTFVPMGGGAYEFTPPLDLCTDGGPACVITFTVCDFDGACITCELPLAIVGVDDPPVCAAPPQKIDEDAFIDFPLCSWAFDPDEGSNCGTGLDCTSIGMPTSTCGGTFTDQGGGTWRYTPPAGYCTPVGTPCIIEYTICDTGGNCTTCSFPLEINGINNPPICVVPAGPLQMDEDSTLDLPLCSWVSDPDLTSDCGEVIDCSEIGPPTASCGGTFAAQGLGTWRYAPPADLCTTGGPPCVITFTVCDEGGECITCFVEVVINAVNDPPVARDDSERTLVDEPVLLDLCINDYDPDDASNGACGCVFDCSTVVVIPPDPACGMVTPQPGLGDGFLEFMPAPGFVGECCFEYEVWDVDSSTGTVCLSDTALVCVEVETPCPPPNLRAPGSLLLYPEFDNRDGSVTVLTVTNTHPSEAIGVHFEYVDGDNCTRSDRTEFLTPNDTLSLLTVLHNPNTERGYVYAFAVCPDNGEAVVFDYLIGNLVVLSGLDTLSYSINPYAFTGIGDPTNLDPNCGLKLTDLDDDGNRDLDCVEYSSVPNRILIPRFLGQSPRVQSELILIGLTGGQQFTTRVLFGIYNDNEVAFSAEHTFYCWERRPLLEINGLFANDYLRNSTDHDPFEEIAFPPIESGWFRIDGLVASSVTTTIGDPAVFAVLVEGAASSIKVSDLPWGEEDDTQQLNGSLLPRTVSGDY